MRGFEATPLRVLVVDDNVDTTVSLAFLLESWGHAVRTAHDGPAAVEAARAFRPDAVVLDIGLPRMDGFKVAQALRADPDLARTFIVAASGYSREEDHRRAAEVGIDLYLPKPADPFRLAKLLAARPPEAVPA